VQLEWCLMRIGISVSLCSGLVFKSTFKEGFL
jgi:hypothetical protein